MSMFESWFAACCGKPPPTEDSGDIKVEPSGPSLPKVKIAIEHEFYFQLHSATRTGKDVPWRSPYAIITADGKEVETTEKDKSHKQSPVWEASHTFQSGTIPHAITVAIYEKSRIPGAKDVFCGSVTVPCAEDMPAIMNQEFGLTKHDLPKGTVKLSMRGHELGADPSSPASPSRQNAMMVRSRSLGAEIDDIMAAVDTSRDDRPNRTISFKESQQFDHPADIEVHEKEDDEERKVQATPSVVAAKGAHALEGSWRCVETHGLEEFLKATGVGMFQRKIALAAKWPSWDFTVKDNKLQFVNHAAIGDLKEEIPLGKDYAWKDGHKNDFNCRAEWTTTSDGGSLVVDRKGSVGNYSEERTVTGDKLVFVLKHNSGVTWGRAFERMR